ncbi:hypothetical protein RI054_42g150250 [Pseudoscourfieldia marina]
MRRLRAGSGASSRRAPSALAGAGSASRATAIFTCRLFCTNTHGAPAHQPVAAHWRTAGLRITSRAAFAHTCSFGTESGHVSKKSQRSSAPSSPTAHAVSRAR